MIIHDYSCQLCGEVTEQYVDSSNIPKTTTCPICKGQCDKVFLPSQTHPVDATWVTKVVEIVDKTSTKPHVKEFVRHPTRANLKAYMQGEGLRHMDRAESPYPKTDHEYRKRTEQREMLRMERERNAISI